MNPRGWFVTASGIDWPTVLLLVLALTTVGGVAVAASTSGVAFGPYNPSWDGASEFYGALEEDDRHDTTLVRDTDQYAAFDPNETVAFVIAPEDSYDTASAEAVATFVEAGGTLVVLENFGDSGNELLADVNASARVDGQLIRDEEYYFTGPTMPIATGVENHTFTAGVEQLTLNYATAVEPGDSEVLIWTSDFAYFADGPDDELDDHHELEEFPMVTIESVENGTVVVVGDPSITTNAMRDEPDNALFLDNVATESESVLVDVSHSDGVPPLMAASLTLQETPLLQGILGVLGIGAMALVARRRLSPTLETTRDRLPLASDRVKARTYERESGTLSADERAAVLRRRYPEWDEDRIERVIAGLNQRETKRHSTNERD